MYFGTGIGNVIYINGEFLLGKDGIAGEIGHIPIIGGNFTCGCGNIGCAECYASGRRLVELRESYFSKTEIRDLFSKHGSTEILLEYIDNIACVAATEINILNPHYVILGGGVIGMEDFPKNYLIERIHKHINKTIANNNLGIYFSENHRESGVRGALYFAQVMLRQLKDSPINAEQR